MERDIHGRAAGLRTHLLVSMAAALFTMLSPFIALLNPSVPGDPGRIAAQIVTGIGFLGAGAIIKEGLTIRGLTTAACLWVVAAIGMASGAGCYMPAFATTVIALIALTLLPYVERWFHKDSYRLLTVITTNDVDVSKIINIVKSQKVKILLLDLDRDYDTNTTTAEFSIRIFRKGVTDKLSHSIIKSIEAANVSLKHITWGH